MSNVLIGVIGVILFIGLALAGALFLGPRFQEATTSSTAAAAVQMVTQVANAARMFQTQEGRTVSANPVGTTLSTQSEDAYKELVGLGYLRTVPRNPVRVGGGEVYIRDEAGVPYVTMAVGDNDAVCRHANRHFGNGDESLTTIGSSGRNGGCHRIASSLPYPVYVLWERI